MHGGCSSTEGSELCIILLKMRKRTGYLLNTNKLVANFRNMSQIYRLHWPILSAIHTLWGVNTWPFNMADTHFYLPYVKALQASITDDSVLYIDGWKDRNSSIFTSLRLFWFKGIRSIVANAQLVVLCIQAIASFCGGGKLCWIKLLPAELLPFLFSIYHFFHY